MSIAFLISLHYTNRCVNANLFDRDTGEEKEEKKEEERELEGGGREEAREKTRNVAKL